MLHFEIDWSQLADVSDEFGASEKQIMASLSRALRRTEASLRKLSMKGLPRILQLQSAKDLRSRIKSIRVRKLGMPGSKGGFRDGAGLWYGLNSLPVSSFKGPMRKTDFGATKKDFYFDGGFIARSSVKGKKTIFKRDGKARLAIEEQTILIEDKAIVFIEDEVFDQVIDIFWGHFQRDLRARVKYKISSEGWR